MGLWIAIFCLFCGFFLQFLPGFPAKKLAHLGKFYLIYLVLPALALVHIPPLKLSWDLALAPSSAWLSFLLSWAILGFLGKKYGWKNSLTGCLILVCGLANTSFLGFPIVELAYGKEGLPIALLIDQGGSFLIVSTLAVVVGSRYGKGEASVLGILTKMIQFPPFIFLLLALLMSFLELSLPNSLFPWLEWLGNSIAAVGLGVIGLSITLDAHWIQSKYLWAGLGYRLILTPALIWIVFATIMPTTSLEFKVIVLENGMAPMITASLVAMEFELEPRLAALFSGLGIPLSALSIWAWYVVLG